jgi:hypothetical protein
MCAPKGFCNVKRNLYTNVDTTNEKCWDELCFLNLLVAINLGPSSLVSHIDYHPLSLIGMISVVNDIGREHTLISIK